MQEYNHLLLRSDTIDFDDPRISMQSEALVHGCSSHEEIVFRIFYFTRDQILYDPSFPFRQASYVLVRQLGNSLGKACLLAALCRNAGIPAGLIFQQVKDLKTERNSKSQRLEYHVVNAVYLGEKWIKLDASHDRWFNLKEQENYSILKESKLFSDVPQYIQLEIGK